MQKRMKIILWLMVLLNINQMKAIEPISMFYFFGVVGPTLAPFVAKTALVGGTVIVGYFADKWINGSRREQKRLKKHQDHIEYISHLSADELEEYLTRVQGCPTVIEIPASWLFEQYDYYQFPEFKIFLEYHPQFEESIIAVRRQLNDPKKFNFHTHQEYEKFESTVRELACKADLRRSQRTQEALEYQRQLERERVKREQQNVYKKYIQETFNEQKNSLSQLHENFACEFRNREDHEDHIIEVFKKRQEALIAYFEERDVWKEQHFYLPVHTTHLLNEHSLHLSSYTDFYGNQIQLVAHSELITILDKTAQLRHEHSTHDDTQSLTTTLTLFADAGRLHNHAGQVEKAFSFVDFCWNMLDMYKSFWKLSGKMYFSEFKYGYDCSAAALKGAWNGAKGFGNKLVALGRFGSDVIYATTHPIETGKVLLPRVKKSIQFVAQKFSERAEENKRWTQETHSRHLYYWLVPSPEEIVLEKEQRREWLNAKAKDAYAVLHNAAIQMQQDGAFKCIENTSEVATEMALSYATGKAIGSMVQAGANAFARSLDELSHLKYVHQLPTHMGTVQGYIVLEASELARAAAVARAMGDDFAFAGDVAGKLGSTQALLDKVSNGTQLKNDNGSIVKSLEGIEKHNYRLEEKGLFAKSCPKTNNIYKTVKSTGEKCRIVRPLDDLKAIEWANEEYQHIRLLSDDIKIISRNTGWTEEKIARIKKHLFYDKHNLRDRIDVFDPDQEIAAAWNRLYKGDFIKNDIQLLHHEYAESKFESLFRTSYEVAHAQVSSKAKWFWDYPEFLEK